MDIASFKEEIIKIRRDLHQIPETGFEEFKTSEYIKNKLLSLGYNVEPVAKTGLLAYKKGLSSKRPICFRTDIDALNLVEKTDLDFASKNGNMHACGHDGHMSILLGFAIYLSKLETINRDVILLFQPGEENAGGADYVLMDENFKKYNTEAIFGLHIQPELEEGKIGSKSGPMMAQTIELNITVIGKSSHGAQPHKGIDAIYVASQLINSYQSIISRSKNPLEPGVLTIGKITGGTARNLIAEEVKLEGTLRSFNMNVYEEVRKRIVDVSKGLEQMYNAQINVDFVDFCPPVVNDSKLYNSFKELFNDDEFVTIEPMTISEDFGFYQLEIPGLFFMLGSRNEQLGYVYPLHSTNFNFNEDILIRGVETYIKVAKKFEIL